MWTTHIYKFVCDKWLVRYETEEKCSELQGSTKTVFITSRSWVYVFSAAGLGVRCWGEMLWRNYWGTVTIYQKARYCISLSCSLMLPLIHLMQFKPSAIAFPYAQFLIWKTHPPTSTVCWKTSQWKPAQGQCWREC